MLAELQSSSLLHLISPFLKSLCGIALFFNVVIGCMSVGRYGKVNLQTAALACSSVVLLLVIWTIFDFRLTPVAVALGLSLGMGFFSLVYAQKWAANNQRNETPPCSEGKVPEKGPTIKGP